MRNRTTKLYFPALLSLIFLLLLVACGGGGSDGNGGDSGGDDGGSGGDSGGSGGNINQGLSGYLYSTESISSLEGNMHYPVIIDIATGKTQRILQDFQARNLTPPQPSADGKTLIMIGKNETCKKNFDPTDVCIYIARQGQSLQLIQPFELFGQAKLSPDGEMLLATGERDNDISTAALRMFTVDGELRENIGNHRVTTYTWLPDGRVMFAERNGNDSITLYQTTEPYSLLNAEPVRTFSDSGMGALVPSHDGKQVAFNLKRKMVNELEYVHAFVMNIDGTGLRQLTDHYTDDPFPTAKTPAWSPDDKWIMVLNDNDVDHPPAKGLFAVRADATEVILDRELFAPEDAIEINTDWGEHLLTTGSNFHTAWVASPPPLLKATSAIKTKPATSKVEAAPLPTVLLGDWKSNCQTKAGGAERIRLNFTGNSCTTLKEQFSDAGCQSLTQDTETSSTCYPNGEVTTPSGLVATQLWLEDTYSEPAPALIYTDNGDTLYLGKGDRLDFDTPYYRQ